MLNLFMTTVSVHHVWPAPIDRDDENKAILPALEKITDSGGAVSVVSEGSLLADFVMLPFIETPDGERYYGKESIEKYADSYQKQRELTPAR